MQRKRVRVQRQIEGEPICFSPIGWISFMSPMPYRSLLIHISRDNRIVESKQVAIDKRSDNPFDLVSVVLSIKPIDDNNSYLNIS